MKKSRKKLGDRALHRYGLVVTDDGKILGKFYETFEGEIALVEHEFPSIDSRLRSRDAKEYTSAITLSNSPDGAKVFVFPVRYSLSIREPKLRQIVVNLLRNGVSELSVHDLKLCIDRGRS